MDQLAEQHVVLLGIGHTNAHILRMWRRQPISATDLTCISDHGIAAYSGMLPAVLAGQLSAEEMQIDLVRLCSSVGARLITDPVTGLDTASQRILFATRPSIPFDVLSVGIGSVPTMEGVDVQGDSLITIKPMQTLIDRLSKALDLAVARRNGKDLRILIVGSGVGGMEIAFCLPPFIRAKTNTTFSLQIISRSDEILPGVSASFRRRVQTALKGVQVTSGKAVVRVTSDNVELDDGARVAADLVLWATSAASPGLLSCLEVPVDDRGFISTRKTLQSISGKPIFAVGDSGSIISEDIPKAGVYAVRQGPVLWENIQRLLSRQTLLEFSPQASFLKLFNTGDESAIGEWKQFSFSGRWVMRLKDRIDTNFMKMYRVDGMTGSEALMPCRGCGCKLSSDILQAALVHPGEMSRSLESFETLDDAALVATTSAGQVLTSTDFFSAPFDDAFLNGRVAALHAASDLTAMGASVTSALSIVVLPEGPARTQRQVLNDFLEGARMEFAAMNAKIIGGHTIVGPRWEVGFTVIGEPPGTQLIRKGSLQAGDLLYLTKPLGIGILLAAHMRSACHAANYFHLIEAMLQRQHAVAGIAVSLGIVAGTDITGFGLIGHLIEMLRASKKSAVLEIDHLPLLPGVAAAVAAGIESSFAPNNRCVEAHIAADPSQVSRPAFKALFDPQTCGGLLLGVSPHQSVQFEAAMQQCHLGVPTRIGFVQEAVNGECRVHIR